MRITRQVGDEGTGDTVPRHIWIHEVELTASRAVPGIDPKFFKKPETHSESEVDSGIASLLQLRALEAMQSVSKRGRR